jgi:hypothetical protein
VLGLSYSELGRQFGVDGKTIRGELGPIAKLISLGNYFATSLNALNTARANSAKNANILAIKSKATQQS